MWPTEPWVPLIAATWLAVWVTCPAPQADSVRAALAASAITDAARRIDTFKPVTTCPPWRQVPTPLARVVVSFAASIGGWPIGLVESSREAIGRPPGGYPIARVRRYRVAGRCGRMAREGMRLDIF